MEIYLPTAGINLPAYYGTMIGPVFGDILLRSLSGLEKKIRGKVLFNCHSPAFRKNYPEEEIIKIIKERKKELSMLRLSDNWQFERDDKLEDKLEPYINMLFSKGIFYLNNNEALFNINKLKKEVMRKIDKIKFFPEYYTTEFKKYLEKKESSQPINGRLEYGYNLKRFGIDTFLNQVWEQAIFSALSDDKKIILSGPNVLGPYTFRAAMLCAYSGNSEIYLIIHSLAKVSDSLKSKLEERERLPMDYIIKSCPKIIDISDYLRYSAALAINTKKVTNLDENDLARSRKALIRLYNLHKVLDRINTRQNLESIDKCIKNIYGITDRFFQDIHLASKLYPKEETNAVWERCVKDIELITGRMI